MPGCTTWVGRPAGWSGCIWTAASDALPEPGAPLELDGRPVGMVGSSARHYELGPIALGLVKRNVPVDADLLADGIAASQEALVDPEIGLHVRPDLR